MEYSDTLQELLLTVLDPMEVILPPERVRIELERKLDEARDYTLNVNFKNRTEELTITKEEVTLLSLRQEAYDTFMGEYESYLDGIIII